MPAAPTQGGNNNTWGTDFRAWATVHADLTTGALQPGVATGAALGTDVVVTTQKDANNGVAGLDASGLQSPAHYYNGLERTFESFGGSVGGNAATQLAAWTAARLWLCPSNAVSGPGGTILFGRGTYANMPPMDIPPRTYLRGAGNHATILTAAANTNANWITTHVSSNGTTEPNGQFICIRDMMLNGNKANQTTGSVLVCDTLPQFGTQSSGDDDFDSHRMFTNLFIFNAKVSGLIASGRSSDTWTNVQAYYCDDNALQPSFDTLLVGCVTGQSGRRGFWLPSPNLRMVGCDAFYAGNITASVGDGFYHQNMSGGIQTLSCCVAQDNRHSGVVIDTCHGVTYTGLAVDSNSFSSPGAVPGIDIFAGSSCYVQANCTDRQGQGSSVGNTQINAIRVRSTSTQNTINIKHWAANTGGSGTYSTIGDPILSWDANCTGNEVSIGGHNGQQAVAYAASIAPVLMSGGSIVVGTLTGAITINDLLTPSGFGAGTANINKFPGMRVTYQLTQDSTGGRVVTWNAVYHLAGGTALSPTLSTRHAITFEWDAVAAGWYEISRSA